MILTILSHMTAVRILFAIGITFTVLPIFFYRIVLKGSAKFKKWLPRIIVPACILCLPMIYYFYLDIRYEVSEFTLNDKLYLAAENRNISAARTLIDDGADPEGENRYGRSAIYRAVMLDDTQMLELYLEMGADPNYTGSEDITLLSVACRNQCNEAVKMLLASGADPDYRTDLFVPALHYAAANDKDYNAELAEMLVNAGADTDSAAVREGKVMLPYRYYFDEYTEDEDITEEDEANFQRIKDILYRPYIEWLMDKMTAENGAERSADE